MGTTLFAMLVDNRVQHEASVATAQGVDILIMGGKAGIRDRDAEHARRMHVEPRPFDPVGEIGQLPARVDRRFELALSDPDGHADRDTGLQASLSRTGGPGDDDDVIIVLRDTSAERIHRAFQSLVFTHDGHAFAVRASLGLVHRGETDGSADGLMAAADIACCAAKEGGRNGLHQFRAGDGGAAMRSNELNCDPSRVWFEITETAAISQIARVMGIRTVAEFVEDRRTLEVLAEIGIDYAQGYHIARPVPLDEVLGAGATDAARRRAA